MSPKTRTKRPPLRNDLARRLWRFILDRYGDPPRNRFAKELGIEVKRVSEYFENKDGPRASGLRLIGQRTGVSIDWLLGFDDVPRYRAHRAQVGDMVARLQVELPVISDTNRAYAQHSDAMASDPNRLLRTIRQAWFRHWELENQALWLDGLTELLAAIRGLELDDDEAWAAKLAEESALRTLVGLVSANVALCDRLAVPAPLYARQYQITEARRYRAGLSKAPVPYYQLPDADVAAGLGFAWRGPAFDSACWITTEGHVISRTGERFLRIGGYNVPPAPALETVAVFPHWKNDLERALAGQP